MSRKHAARQTLTASSLPKVAKKRKEMEKRLVRLSKTLVRSKAENAGRLIRDESAYTPIRALPKQADAGYMFAA